MRKLIAALAAGALLAVGVAAPAAAQPRDRDIQELVCEKSGDRAPWCPLPPPSS
jgi:hypothetical protein